ncbi:MAG: hypothetical protein EBT07_01765 [Actinobacteria bacterium]|jgi:hypothetical protein|nr:hypothetical protein [Actinomycetota bacterium]
MAWRPWWEEIQEIQSATERQEFVRGIFGSKRKDQGPIIAGLVGGYLGAKVATTKAQKKK